MQCFCAFCGLCGENFGRVCAPLKSALEALFEEIFDALAIGGGGFGDEAAGVGEVDVGLGFEGAEVEEGAVVVAVEGVAGATAVGIDHADECGFVFEALDVAGEAHGGFFGERVGAGEEEDFMVSEVPDFGVFGDEVEALAEAADVGEEVITDHAENFPEGIAGEEFALAGEASEDGEVDGGVEFGEGFAFGAEPFCGFDRASGVEPFGGFEPVAEGTGVFVEAEVFEDEGEGAGRLVVAGKLVVVEIEAFGFVAVSDVEDAGLGVVEFEVDGVASVDGNGVFGEEEGGGEEFVFMGAAGMGDDLC